MSKLLLYIAIGIIAACLLRFLNPWAMWILGIGMTSLGLGLIYTQKFYFIFWGIVGFAFGAFIQYLIGPVINLIDARIFIAIGGTIGLLFWVLPQTKRIILHEN
ncbi:MAG: hypothetical protein WCT08_05420 [Patescibacteria group bacterium]|jgi:hypothetical protein